MALPGFRTLSKYAVLVFIFLVGNPCFSSATEFPGNTGTRNERPQRIVSLSPHLTEILFKLGLGDRVVGVTEYSDYPEAAGTKERVGTYVKLNLEKIISLHPDLVIGTREGNPRITVQRLRELGLNVFLVYPKNIQDIFRDIRRIGSVTGAASKAEALASELEQRAGRIAAKVQGLKKPTVFFQLGLNPLYTAGKNTFIDRLITLAGGVNLAGEKTGGYLVYSMEEVLKRGPDVIFCALMHQDHGEALAFWKKWQTVPAVRNGRVYVINPDWTNRPSPRIILGLEAMARYLHPEAFGQGIAKKSERSNQETAP